MSDSDDRPSHALSPYPTSRLAPAFSLVDVASEIARADETIARVTEARLEVIARQGNDHLTLAAAQVLEGAFGGWRCAMR